MVNDSNKKIDKIEKLVEVIATNVVKLVDKVNNIKKDVEEIKTDLSEVKTDLKSFKTETRESFDKLEKNLKENEESIGAVVADYHPHIIALEEKVFGSSTLAES